MDIEFTRKAGKQFDKLDATTQTRIRDKLRAYASYPASQAANVTPLKGAAGYRLRVGDYRVLFMVDDGPPRVMVVYKVAHRKDVYND